MKNCLHCGQEFKPKRKEQGFCSKSCAGVLKGKMSSKWMKGRTNRYKGAKQVDKDGYIRICGTGHPFRYGRLMIPEHIAIMEKHLGRRLSKEEVVHHRNGNRQDNRVSNLEIMKRSEHCSLHAREAVQLKNRNEHGQFIAS